MTVIVVYDCDIPMPSPHVHTRIVNHHCQLQCTIPLGVVDGIIVLLGGSMGVLDGCADVKGRMLELAIWAAQNLRSQT